ncbi:hypothetical protein EYZ11_013477 [Aspergillus tanneri]|uniref:Uncharacterized protein n=1 Tax=Aspergillus tanneri TaxID=1220188 RepID=A0A4S3IZT7_9EURO|nr:hypothetical protein EYZ11_013477 [Aspergillus tanneri]
MLASSRYTQYLDGFLRQAIKNYPNFYAKEMLKKLFYIYFKHYNNSKIIYMSSHIEILARLVNP